MATSFDRWEKDPFFSAAEEVQESADRMESTYRTWFHSKKDASSIWNSEELRRDLRTAVGTTKWQLEEFERAVKHSYVKNSIDDSRDRHREFIIAIEDHISRVEKSLQEHDVSEGKPQLPGAPLDEGEFNELALFLLGPSAFEDTITLRSNNKNGENKQDVEKKLTSDCLKNSGYLVELRSLDAGKEKSHGHRRAASGNADIGAWKIAITDNSCQMDSSNGQVPQTPRKVPSVSGFLSSMESMPKFKWPKNGVRKWKATDHHQESDTAPLQSLQLTRGVYVCYEKSKNCLDNSDECYSKDLYSWCGMTQRQLQRSQYHLQYNRSMQWTFGILLLLCLIVLIASHAL